MKQLIFVSAMPLILIAGAMELRAISSKTPMETSHSVVSASPTLRDAYKGKFLIGAAVSNELLSGRDEALIPILGTQFNSVTAENAMKPDAIQPREGDFQFKDADRLVELAKKSRSTVVGHTLVWHAQTPRWFFEGKDGQPITRELALQRLRTHIKTLVGRYKGRVKQWDVVNEAINDGPGILRNSPWLRAIGDDYIAEAFRAAHEADPKAILIYNDYNIELDYKRPKAVELLKKLKEQGVPVHGVGIQSHWRLENFPLAEMEKAIQEYSALGLKVMITELDLGVLPSRYQGADISRREQMTPEQREAMNPYTKGLPEAVAAQQAEKYKQAFELFLRYQKNIGRVTLWGIHDGHSWLNGFPVRGRTEYALLFDRSLQPKPAFFSVVEAAKRR